MSTPSLSIYHLEPPPPPPAPSHSSPNSSSLLPPPPRKQSLNIAVVGCAHGQLSSIYSTLAHLSSSLSLPIHLLLCCGDFQATRSPADLSTLACPAKYRQLGSFPRWWSAGAVPVPTVYIGGNHEASNVHMELPYGGWVCPGVYFLGLGAVIRVNGWRVGGLSGIYKPGDYYRGHHERLPLGEDGIRSVYHVREFDAWRLTLLAPSTRGGQGARGEEGGGEGEGWQGVDVFMSHDWPRGIEQHGDTEGLLRTKPFFREEVRTNSLGSEAAEWLLRALQPTYWFSAHLHVKFAAVYKHELALKGEGRVTRFLALDKALPGRDYMQLLPLTPTEARDGETGEEKGEVCFQYDLEWLCVLKKTAKLINVSKARCGLPGGDWTVSMQERQWMWARVKGQRGERVEVDRMLDVPLNYHKGDVAETQTPQGKVRFVRNPQSTAFCHLLDIPDVYSDAFEGGERGTTGAAGAATHASCPSAASAGSVEQSG